MQQKFNFGVHCPEDCNLSIRVFYTKDHTLTLNDEKFLQFNEERKSLKIDSTNNVNKTESIVIEFELMNPMEINHTFSLYGKLRNE